MFKSRTEGSIVYKCTVRLLEELDVLECEFQVRVIGVIFFLYFWKLCDIDFCLFVACIIHAGQSIWVKR